MLYITNKVDFKTELTKNMIYSYYMRLYVNTTAKEKAEETCKSILGNVRRVNTKFVCSLEIRKVNNMFYFYQHDKLVAATYVNNFVDTLNTLQKCLSEKYACGYKVNKNGQICIKEEV